MADASSDVIVNVTLEDDVWKDSFDKLLAPRPVLRELNVLKKNVRASFNMNSSVENCTNNSKDLSQVHTPLLKLPTLQLPSPGLASQAKGRSASISTPLGNHLISNPFKCSLSPITAWKLRYVGDKSDVEKNVQVGFNATPINSELVVVDYDTEKAVSFIPEQLEEPLKQQKRKTTKPTKTKSKRKTNQRHVFFESITESLQRNEMEVRKTSKTRSNINLRLPSRGETTHERPTSLPSTMLQPGKWRKSLNIWRRTHQNIHAQNRVSANIEHSANNDDSIINTCVVIVGRRRSIFFKSEPESEVGHRGSSKITTKNVWEERVLRRCKQNAVVDFAQAYRAEQMTNCKKIGEGAYGEVFINSFNGAKEDTVLKIIPIEGKKLINGEVQKTYEQILPEIVISVELSALNDTEQSTNSTSGFVGIRKVACVKGKYPAHLLSLWEAYDNEKGSENDNPDILPSEQHYIVLELSYGGMDLESFVFNNAEQSFYALQQIVLILAVGEAAFQFEHRDLHWGNILLVSTAEKHVNFKLKEKTLTLATKGVKVTIIDYTLSRLSYEDGCFYNDLSYDEELFTATGDHQFDIYRMMRDVLKNKWKTFEPKTNIYWISYIIRKMLQGVNYKSTRTKTHTAYINKLTQLDAIALNFNSAIDCANYFKKII